MRQLYTIKNILVFAILNCCSFAYAQQTPGYTQYMYNTMAINPGYTSSVESAEVNLLYRTQWVGLDGAPKTANFSALTPFSYERMGIGLNVVNDRIGPANETLATVNYAYNVRLSLLHNLALGVNAGAKFMNIDWSKGRRIEDADPVFGKNINDLKPVVGAGIYFYTDKYYVGLAVPNFVRSNYYDDIQQAHVVDALHYYLIAGYVFNLSSSVKFKPSAMVRAVQGAPLSYDLSANFMFHDKFTIGASYRWDDSVSGLAGFQVSDAIFIGYAYDYTTTNLVKYNHGSHEIMLKFRLLDKHKTIKSPRFF
ncbi:type IX secretion system membrane protein PorP/SprF [Flavobacterium agricola]|uniref:Type IX secretion system membrane protein PorP/SprF n=1 Tax=Flavobacterium agricola TaxID=2870839 RepID=A0ABY6M0I8_9FLAO|nr:type IX secretion system membrane protein PorP/SprF [Flavobacterium agricola]UYW02009.1 type IX secretion system membrane protein PorP/SprF [Flavobacterium agricola]